MTMKARDFDDAQNIINNIKDGTVTRRDLVALLIYIREYLPNDMIKDLAHCVAHSGRDRGHLYSHIGKFVSDLIQVIEQGGTWWIRPVFFKHELVETMTQDLTDMGFDVSKDDIARHYKVLVAGLSDILYGTEMCLKHPNVKTCRFEEARIEGELTVGFVVRTQGLNTLDSEDAASFADGIGFACSVFW